VPGPIIGKFERMTSTVGSRPNAGVVVAVSTSPQYTFTKATAGAVHLIAGHGVEGDIHAGVTVKHRSRVAADPTKPNLRQVHLLHAELFDELAARGFALTPGLIGENVTTRGVDLLALPTGARLQLGTSAVIEITGLRNPCYQLDDLQKGLLKAVLDRDAEGNLVRKAGIMAIVITGGEVRPGDTVTVTLPSLPHRRLEAV
jgi:MOSC domain-containing protein YiiM